MADILALLLLHNEQIVEQSATKSTGNRPAVQAALNFLNRLSEARKPKPLKPPPVLLLVTESHANTARYDYLRGLRRDHDTLIPEAVWYDRNH